MPDFGAAACGDPATPTAPIRASRFARQLLRRRHRRLVRRAPAGIAGEPAERHALRIAAKKLRYAAEFFASLLDGDRARDYVDALAALQDVLGRGNDAVTAARLAHELATGGDDRAVALLDQWLAATATAREPEIARAWKGFARTKRFWQRSSEIPMREDRAMLESAEIGHKVDKKVYAREEVRLREALLNAQFELAEKARGPVLVLISGVESGGRGETANLLTAWMDPRHIRVFAFGPPTPEELARPVAWRYWRALPPTGKIGIFMNAWYREALFDRVAGRIGNAELDVYLQEVRREERMLADEGIVLLKFWIHLSRDAQKKRIAKFEADPHTRWRITAADKRALKLYSKSHDIWEHVLRETSTGMAPWYVVEGADERYRGLTVGKILLDTLQRTLAAPAARRPAVRAMPPAPSVVDNVKLIRELDLDKTVTDKEYDRGNGEYQRRLAQAVARQALRRARARARVRGRRRSRQGWRDPARVGCARCAPVHDRSRSRRRPTRSACIPTSGASGAIFRRAAASRSSTAAGTAGCWWSACRDSVRSRSTGPALTTRSINSRSSWCGRVSSSSSSGCRSARKSS